jgi:hypothetical protein
MDGILEVVYDSAMAFADDNVTTAWNYIGAVRKCDISCSMLSTVHP